MASTDSGEAEEARRSCEIEVTLPCPTGESGGVVVDCCEVRISISEKSEASSTEDGADKGQGVSFMVNRYLERRFAINKNSSSSCSNARTGYQTCKDLPLTIKDLPTALAPHPAAMLELAIRGASMDQQTIKDLPTTLAPHPAAMQGLTNRRSRIDQQTFGGIRKALQEGVHICLAHW